MAMLRAFIIFCVRLITTRRYHVTINGIEGIKNHPGPFLILPNHPAYTDPPNILAHLYHWFKMRAMLLEDNFQSPLFSWFPVVFNSIKVPQTERASQQAAQRAEGAVAEVAKALRAGDNVVLWPSGTLSRDGTDKIGAARTAADVLRAVPEATVVVVRTRGMWGSKFSWARGEKPRLVKELMRGAWQILGNLIFFAPKREVTITLEFYTAANRPQPSRDVINPWLESRHNIGAPEVPTFVPYHFLFGPRTFDYPAAYSGPQVDASKVKPATKDAVQEILEFTLKRELTTAEKQPETQLADMGMDSLESTEVALKVEERFGFRADLIPTTVGELWALAEGQLESGPLKPAPESWFKPVSDTKPLEVLAETVPAAFLARALKHPKDVAVADDIAGVLNYEKLLVGALVMAKRFQELPGEYVGLLLPSAVGCDIAFLGLQLAGKIPVLLNWTTGPGNMAHAVDITKATRVITSQAFIDRTRLTVPGAEFVYLENVRKGIGKLELLKTLYSVRWFSGSLQKNLLARLPNDPQRPAAVLFTSGSEKAPKAVPLTHANIIADQRAAVGPQGLSRADTILSFLPVFHSFGLTISTLFPLLAGVKMIHHPDPADAGKLARKIASYRPSIICGTPTFAAMILSKLSTGELDSLRILVVGAEACPPDVFEKVKSLNPKAAVLEGYGITECSPCVSVNPVWAPKRGTIGKPLPGIKVCVLDGETNKPLPPNTRGILHVAGPIVFPGYLAHDGPQPFLEHDGERWYITGDLGEIDNEGYITFHGRLKRFLKAGGEMISLPALEEPFARLFPPTENGPRVAVEGIETERGRTIVLFTTFEYTTKQATEVLYAEGHRGVMRVDEVRMIEMIPVLGTGKTDYKLLRAMVEAK